MRVVNGSLVVCLSEYLPLCSVRNWDFSSLARGTVALNNLM